MKLWLAIVFILYIVAYIQHSCRICIAPPMLFIIDSVTMISRS